MLCDNGAPSYDARRKRWTFVELHVSNMNRNKPTLSRLAAAAVGSLMAFAVFLLVKNVNRFRKQEEAAPAAPPEIPADVKLLTEIRDLLKQARA